LFEFPAIFESSSLRDVNRGALGSRSVDSGFEDSDRFLGVVV